MKLLKRFPLAAAVAVLTLAAGASPSQASPVTFSFTGVFTQVDANPVDPFNGRLGDFGGFFTFDSASLDAVTTDPTSGSYTSPVGAPFQFHLDVTEDIQFTTNDFLNIGIVNGPTDMVTVLACAGGPSCRGNLILELFFQDLDGLVFSNDGLPLDAPPLGAFEIAKVLLLTEVDGNSVEAQGIINRLQCTAGCSATPPPPTPEVPEPTSVLLCATGLSGMYLRLLRRQK